MCMLNSIVSLCVQYVDVVCTVCVFCTMYAWNVSAKHVLCDVVVLCVLFIVQEVVFTYVTIHVCIQGQPVNSHTYVHSHGSC